MYKLLIASHLVFPKTSYSESSEELNINKIKASLEIIRPVNALMGGIGAIVGAVASGFFSHPQNLTFIGALIYGFIVVFCISAAGMIINDIVDIEVDRVNCPERPLPSGRLSLRDARILFCFFLVAGLSLGGLLWGTLGGTGWAAFLIIAIGVFLVVGYSIKLKRFGITGNVVVALVTSMSLLLGGSTQNRLDIAIWPALVAFLINMAREITKGIDDLAGDAGAGVKTLAVLWGPPKAAIAAGLFMFSTMIISPVPYILQYFNLLYLAGILGIDILVLYVIVSLLRDPSPANAHKLKTYQKIGMFLGLVAFLVGAIHINF